MSVRIVRIKDTSSCFQLYFGPSTFLVGSLFEFDDSNHAALKHLFGNETVQIDYIILLDAHLTTCGNLPIILNELGYTGAIFSTDATRLLAPLLLSEFIVDQIPTPGQSSVPQKQGVHSFFCPSSMSEAQDRVEKVTDCFKRINSIPFDRKIQLQDGVTLSFHPSGKIPEGSACLMIQSTEGLKCMLVDGTNLEALPNAGFPRLEPDVLYLSTSKLESMHSEPRTTRRRKMMREIHECIQNGGKILIPCYSIGEFQHLYPIISNYLRRSNLNVPIFTHELMKLDSALASFLGPDTRERNDALRLQPFQPQRLDDDDASPWIVFGHPTREMLDSFHSKPQNLVLYCKSTQPNRFHNCQCRVSLIPESSWLDTDGRTVFQSIRQLSPWTVAFVAPGVKARDSTMKNDIATLMDWCQDELEIFVPTDAQRVLTSRKPLSMDLSPQILEDVFDNQNSPKQPLTLADVGPHTSSTLENMILTTKDGSPYLMLTPSQCSEFTQQPIHRLRYVKQSSRNRQSSDVSEMTNAQMDEIDALLEREIRTLTMSEICLVPNTPRPVLQLASIQLGIGHGDRSWGDLSASWDHVDDTLASRVIQMGHRVMTEVREKYTPAPEPNLRRKVALW